MKCSRRPRPRKWGCCNIHPVPPFWIFWTVCGRCLPPSSFPAMWKSVFVADVHDVPGVGHFARPHHAAVLGNDVSAEDDQCRFGNGTCGVQRIFPPVPALLDDVRILGVLVRIKVIDQQHVGTYGLVSRTTRRLPGTQCAERNLPFGGEFILGP